MNTKEELAGCIQAPSTLHQRQRGRPVTSRARKQGAPAILALETSILHQTVSRLPVANHVLLGFWTVDICQEGHSLRSAPPEETLGIPEMVLSWCTRESERLGMGRWLRHTVHQGQYVSQTPACLSCSDLSSAQNSCPTQSRHFGVHKKLSGLDLGSAPNAGPTLDNVPAEHPEAWAV